MLLYVHRDCADYQGRGAQNDHLDFSFTQLLNSARGNHSLSYSVLSCRIDYRVFSCDITEDVAAAPTL